MTTACTNLLKTEFPSMDNETTQYIEGKKGLRRAQWIFEKVWPEMFIFFSGILSGDVDDFETGDDLYDAIGAILHEVAIDKDEDDIRFLS